MSKENTILEIKNLTKHYGETVGVENLSLELKKAEIFGFIGPNGAGKSTTIRSVMDIINKTEGSVLFEGKELIRDNVEMKRQIGYLPGEINLYDDLTVKGMLDYHESFFKGEEAVRKRRNELVGILELDEKKRVDSLSLGNLKKLGIVLALMHGPKLLILDEPTSGLDPIMQNNFYEILKKEKEKGTTIFYSTHILGEISKLCDRVGIIKDGHLIKMGSIEELSDKNLNFVTVTSDNAENIVKRLNGVIKQREGNTIKFANNVSTNELLSVLSEYDIEKLLVEEAALEDIFLHYYTED